MSVSFLKGKLKSSPNMPLFQCPAVTLLAAIWLKWLMNRRRIIHPLRSQPLGEWSDGPESIDFLSIPYIYDISHTFPCNSAWPLSSHSDPWNPSSDHPNLMDPTSDWHRIRSLHRWILPELPDRPAWPPWPGVFPVEKLAWPCPPPWFPAPKELNKCLLGC